jgi:hypothetical protein
MIVQLMADPYIQYSEDPQQLHCAVLQVGARLRFLNAEPQDVKALQQKLLTAFVEVLNETNSPS